MASTGEHSTLSHLANDGASAALADYIEAKGAVSRLSADRADHLAGAHATALETLAEHVRMKGRRDERLYVIGRLGRWLGWFPDDQYRPGPQQHKLFGMLGYVGPTPPPDQTLTELAAAAVDDAMAETEDRHGELRREAGRTEALEADVRAAESRAVAAEDRATAAENRAEESETTVRELREQLDHAQARDIGDPLALPTEKSEWKAVEGETGIYERENAEGQTVYRIGWRESGRQRWLAIGPDIEEARTTRAKTLEEIEEGVAA